MKSIVRKIIVSIVTFEAKLLLRKYKPTIIGITGNIGKTSTKDAIVHTLMPHMHVRGSAKSFNSEFGVPLTILGEDTGWGSVSKWFGIIARNAFRSFRNEDFPKVLVLEIGADHKGDIKNITKWVKPDIGVVTQFQPVPVHIENFASREDLINEKGYLVKATKKNGLVLYTSDDHDSHELSKLAKCETQSFGFENWSDLKVESVDTLYEVYGDKDYPVGTSARITLGDETVVMRIMGVLGAGFIYAALPALLIAKRFGISLKQAVPDLLVFETPKGRMKVLRGIKKSTVIDDTYNASPKAVEHALKTLAGLHTDGKKIAILGDMRELGEKSVDEHERIGAQAAESVHMLVTVGELARGIAEGAQNRGMDEKYIFQFDTAREAGSFMKQMISEQDIVLVKGSQGVRMERATEELIAEVDRKEELLVRQSQEWYAKE